MANETSPRARPTVAVIGAAAAACAVVASFVFLDFRGPRAPGQPAPDVQLAVSSGAEVLASGAKLPRSAGLTATVTLPRAARVSLVHVDPGHGMEPLVLNLALEAGAHPVLKDGVVVKLELADLAGPQVLAAVASERDLIVDEALTAARGAVVGGTTVSRFEFSVGP